MQRKNHENVRRLTGVAILMAVVVVLQLLGSFIRFGTFSISLVLVPIVIGAALYGVGAGAWLGFVFGVAVLLSGDAAVFLGVTVFGTAVTVLAKGTLAGLCAGWLYRLTEKKSRTVATAVAAVACPVVNTGVFLLGCLVFFMPTINGWAAAWAETLPAGTHLAANAGTYMIVGLVGLNFLVELAVNVVLCPVIVRLIRMAKKH